VQGTRFSSLRIAPTWWLSLITIFELSVSAIKVSRDVRAYDVLRRALGEDLARTDAILRGELEADEAYFEGRRKGMRGRGAGGKTIVFLNPGARRKGLGQYRPGGISGKSHGGDGEEGKKRLQSYTQTRGEDTIRSCSVAIKHLSIDHRYTFKQGKVDINGIEGV